MDIATSNAYFMGRQRGVQAWPLILALDSNTRRPLKCRYCQRSYKYKLSLNMHIKETHLKEALKLKNRSMAAIKSYIKSMKAAQTKPVLANIGAKTLVPKENRPESAETKRTFSVIIRNPNLVSQL